MPLTIRLLCLSTLVALAAKEQQITRHQESRVTSIQFVDTAHSLHHSDNLLQRESRVNSIQLVDTAQKLHHSDETDTKRPCQCAGFESAWQPPSERLPRCIYVDLGAADGNSYKPFLEGKFGPVENCGTTENPGDFEAFLVEANPFFDTTLQNLGDTGKGKVHAMHSTAAYMCDGSTTFWLDNDPEHNFWGSSMDGKPHKWPWEGLSLGQILQLRSTAQTGHAVTVPTMNLMKLLYEQTIPGDWVIVKMDIEGAEWDIVPCLANSPVAALIDQLYVEEHPIDWQLGNTTREEMDHARQTLTESGIQMPQYWSPTL